MVILLNKAHYWVLKQHTDSTPQLTLSRSLTVERSFMLFSLLPRSRGNSINYTSVLFAMQIRFPWFTPQCFFPKLLHHHQPATWDSSKQETKTLYNWKTVKPLLTRRNTEENSSFFPPRRGDSYNYTDHQTALQPEKGWSGPQVGPWKGLKHPPRHQSA